MSWIGGKKALRELIVSLFPIYYERYIEVFGGGGWVLFHKPPGNDFEVYNDFNGLLVNLYRCVREKPEELMEALRFVLNGYYAQLDLERGESPPELKGGTKRLPGDAVSFTDEITECDGKLNFYIPTYFDPDAVFGTHVCTDANDDWVDVYAGFDWKTGRMDSALTVRLCCTDGHEFEFSYRLSPTEQVQLWEKMDAYCRQQNGQSLEEARAALLQTQAEEGMEIRM